MAVPFMPSKHGITQSDLQAELREQFRVARTSVINGVNSYHSAEEDAIADRLKLAAAIVNATRQKVSFGMVFFVFFVFTFLRSLNLTSRFSSCLSARMQQSCQVPR
jgi:hypothetical protein